MPTIYTKSGQKWNMKTSPERLRHAQLPWELDQLKEWIIETHHNIELGHLYYEGGAERFLEDQYAKLRVIRGAPAKVKDYDEPAWGRTYESLSEMCRSVSEGLHDFVAEGIVYTPTKKELNPEPDEEYPLQPEE